MHRKIRTVRKLRMVGMRRSSMLALAVCLLGASPAAADSLGEALVATYKNNPLIKAERKRQAATDEGVAQALSGFRPSASAGYAKGRQRTDAAGAGWNYGDTESKTLRVEQPLFRGFGTLSSYNAAKQRVRAGKYVLLGV